MYEIATLKTKKLPELQEIAKKIGIKKTAGLKKLDLIYQIVDLIASKPDENTASKFDSNNEICSSSKAILRDINREHDLGFLEDPHFKHKNTRWIGLEIIKKLNQ